MDFLGLRNLDVIENCLNIIEDAGGERPDMASLPLDDPKTFEMMCRGDSIGVFQFESEGMRETLRKVRPNEFEDFVALNALYRPGAMALHRHLRAQQAQPAARSTYIDERLRPITEATYGVMLYQEQLMQISKTIAGFTGAQADDLRKAIGKKKREQMAAPEGGLLRGRPRQRHERDVINQLWAVNEAAADYSFNRSHAACYGLIGYRTAWLKANYPAEYMAALISSVMSTKDKVPFFVAHCEDMGINVLPPDVNESAHDFTVHTGESGDRDTVRFGLDAVKNVGSAAVDKIVRGARGRRAVHQRVGLLPAGRLPGREPARDRGADQVRRAGLHRRHALGHVLGHGAGPGRGPEGPAGRPAGPGLDLRPRRARAGRRRGRARPAGARAARRARAGQRLGEGDARAVPVLAPAEGGAARAAPARGLLAGRPVRPQVGRPEGRGRAA